ncbi:MAG: IS110 family transposase [Acidimicrobiia bacterium]|nr:IS110 family transposase [Acidimicrobiia bacterium]
MVIIGIDPHKASHTAAALDDSAQPLGQVRVQANSKTLQRLLEWAEPWPERSWAIEGANGLGRHLAQQLIGAGEVVVDVPATLAARARLLQTGHGRKTDSIDALSAATVALHRTDLNVVAADDHTTILRLLSDRRDELNEERRRTINRLHRILRDLIAGGASIELSADIAAALLGKVRAVTGANALRKAMARELVVDVRRLDKALAQNRARCAQAVAVSGTTLTEIFGIAEVVAAKVAGHTGDITRFASENHFASYTGTAPIEASSGDVKRHRLSRAGNRKLNNALHLAARTQTCHPGPGQDYYRRKIADGKSPTEALRSLKRQISKAVYRQLVTDQSKKLALTP